MQKKFEAIISEIFADKSVVHAQQQLSKCLVIYTTLFNEVPTNPKLFSSHLQKHLKSHIYQ